ncbi:MAG TPA: hypothetical protein DCM07_16560 [Planctomycetaceae bacterium]|nr:hypothetical protein [Gimesia sp.]HAH46430.1 hypothetical protein [Planctomycetaceae bacterium]HBL47848.1 hypothetical protein [Planctomycetaceae bacterium]
MEPDTPGRQKSYKTLLQCDPCYEATCGVCDGMQKIRIRMFPLRHVQKLWIILFYIENDIHSNCFVSCCPTLNDSR